MQDMKVMLKIGEMILQKNLKIINYFLEKIMKFYLILKIELKQHLIIKYQQGKIQKIK